MKKVLIEQKLANGGTQNIFWYLERNQGVVSQLLGQIVDVC